MDLLLEDNRTYPIENKLRTFCSIPHYLVWGLFDCDRKQKDNSTYAGIGDDDWDDDNDGRVDVEDHREARTRCGNSGHNNGIAGKGSEGRN